MRRMPRPWPYRVRFITILHQDLYAPNTTHTTRGTYEYLKVWRTPPAHVEKISYIPDLQSRPQTKVSVEVATTHILMIVGITKVSIDFGWITMVIHPRYLFPGLITAELSKGLESEIKPSPQ